MKTTILTIIFILSTFLNPQISATSIQGEPEILVRLIGYEKEQPVFLVHILNAENDQLTLSFLFNDGEILYSDTFRKSDYTKRFRMNIENIEDAGLQLEIRNKTSGKTETFEIKKNTRYIAETIITKLK